MFEDFSEKYLFPHLFQKIGLYLFLSGIVAFFLRFGLDIKPDFLDIKVFAVYSSFFQTNYFSLVGNNISEEIIMLLMLSGIFFISMSCEKTESDKFWQFRVKSFLLSVYINSILLVLSVIFVFGFGFVGVLSANLVSFLLFYSLIFRYYIRSAKKEPDKV